MFKNIVDRFCDSPEIDTYIEPFGGSFSIGLKVLDRYPSLIYNDLEKNVYSLYKVLSDKEMFSKFQEKCELAVYCSEFRKEYKKELRSNVNLSLVDRAFMFFYVNRTSRNGIGGISVNTMPRRKMSKSVSDFLSSIDRLGELHQKISKLVILNEDGIELLKKYDRRNVFFYLDPPYEQSTRTEARYSVDMSEEIQNRFLATLVEIKHAKWLLSGYDCELYQKYLGQFARHSFVVKTVGGNGKPKEKTEWLWSNYSVNQNIVQNLV